MVLGTVVRLKPVLIWKGEPQEKIYRELTKLNKTMKGIVQTVTPKAKTNEAAMHFIIRETLRGAVPFAPGEKGVYAADGAPSHMHASVCDALQAAYVRMPLFISPPTSTPYAQACDKSGFNGTFSKGMEEEYASWAGRRLMSRKKRGPVPTPSREEVATWVVRSFASITDDAIRHACRTAYFPNGLKLSQLDDVDYFNSEGNRPLDPESSSDSGSETDTDSEISSDSSSSDDSDSGSGDGCEIVFAKAGRGTWGLCHTFDGNLYLTRDLMEGSFVPKDLKVPKVKNVPPPPPPLRRRLRRQPNRESMSNFSRCITTGKGSFSPQSAKLQPTALHTHTCALHTHACFYFPETRG